MKTPLTLLLLIVFISTAAGQPDDKVAKTPKLNYDWRPGFISITEITGGPGINLTYSPYSKYYYGITTVAGYQFTRNIKAGIGAGVHIHNDGSLFPLYIDARYSFSAQELVPFIAAAGGLALNFSEINNTWVFINPSVGIKWVAANKVGISFSGGIMTMSGEQNRNSYVSFKLGLELKGK
jgi:hypothetical protein